MSKLVLKIFILVAVNMLLLSTHLTSQTLEQQKQIRQELKDRNITEAELDKRLKEKGINVKEIPPTQLPSYETIIRQTVMELEEEKKRSSDTLTDTSIIVPVIELPDPDVMEIDEVEVIVKETGDRSIYGHDLFADKNLAVYKTTDGARAPETYILGTGDKIRVTIFGASQTDLLLEINSEGFISPTGLPQIFLKGLSIAQAKTLLQNRLSRFYTFKPDQLALTMHTARAITINIFGEATMRGSFTVSALNTAFNALSAAGGPSEIGSIRNIQHIRGSKRKILDVYKFMYDPTVQFEFDLQHNDIIYIPVAEKVVQIKGAVKRPMSYELTQNENLTNLIEYAGGLNYDTYPEFIQIERIENGEVMLREWSLADALGSKPSIELKDGDIVRLKSVNKPLFNFVEISGAVFYPGRYDLRQNSSLYTILERAQFTPQSKTDILFIERTLPDESIRVIPIDLDPTLEKAKGIYLEPMDKILVFEHERYRTLATLTVSGEVRMPFERRMHFDERITLAHALSLAGGAKPTAFETAFVIRQNIMNPEIVEHFTVSILNDWDFKLQPGDKLNVYSQNMYTSIPQISVQGEVNSPFTTRFEDGLTVTELIKMAGGTTIRAALNRIDVIRLNLDINRGTFFETFHLEVDSSFALLPQFDKFRLTPFDQIVVRSIPMFQVERTAQLSGEVMYPGVYPLESRRIHLSDLIKDAKGLTPQADPSNATLTRPNQGPIGINLRKALANRRDQKFDPILYDGDVITIPQFQNTISIRLLATRLGELKERDVITDDDFIREDDQIVNFIYHGPRSAKWYIENFAGGFVKSADKRSVTITHRNGQVQGTKRRLFFFNNYPTVMPGSTIALTFEPPKEPKGEESVDWDRLYLRTTQATSSLLTILILLNQLK